MLNKLFFFIPGLYRFHTRESGKIKLVPFFLTDFIPVILCFFAGKSIINLQLFFSFLLSYFAMFNFYELGYITNDVITIRCEKNPTLRLNQSELEYANKMILLIIAFRLIIFAIFECLLISISQNEYEIFLISNIILLAVYSLHNYFRNSIKYFTDFILNISKYVIPLIPFFPFVSYASFIFLIIAFPVMRTICYILEKRNCSQVRLIQAVVYFIFFISALLLNYQKIIPFYITVFYGIFSLYRISVLKLRR